MKNLHVDVSKYDQIFRKHPYPYACPYSLMILGHDRISIQLYQKNGIRTTNIKLLDQIVEVINFLK